MVVKVQSTDVNDAIQRVYQLLRTTLIRGTLVIEVTSCTQGIHDDTIDRMERAFPRKIHGRWIRKKFTQRLPEEGKHEYVASMRYESDSNASFHHITLFAPINEEDDMSSDEDIYLPAFVNMDLY